MMDISVIIVNYHSAKMVMDCINSIYSQTRGASFEIIVVDNASGDGSVELLRETFGERITVIASPENLGFGRANNLGAAQAKGKYLFLLNPDTLLVNDALGILGIIWRNTQVPALPAAISTAPTWHRRPPSAGNLTI